MQIISNIALISINETLVIQLISFLVFLFLINKIMFRPLVDTMSERDSYIDGIHQGIEDTAQEMQDILNQLKEREAAIRGEAYDLRSSLEHEGSQKAAEIYAKLQAEIAALKQKNEADVEKQVQEAKKHLLKESEALASQIMEKVLDRRLA